MSLVAYASSDESEPDEPEPEPEEEDVAAPMPGPTLGGLFASLPAPKGPALLPPPPPMLAPAFPPPLLLPPPPGDPRLQPPPPLPFGLGGFPPPAGVSPAEAAGVGEGLGLPSPHGPGLSLPPAVGSVGPPLGLPKPKKRTEPVRIAAPELHKGDVSIWGRGERGTASPIGFKFGGRSDLGPSWSPRNSSVDSGPLESFWKAVNSDALTCQLWGVRVSAAGHFGTRGWLAERVTWYPWY